MLKLSKHPLKLYSAIGFSCALLLMAVISLPGCKSQIGHNVAPGIWRVELDLKVPDAKLPFFMEIIQTDSGIMASIWNGAESIVHDEVSWRGDSLVVRSPYFDSEIVAVVSDHVMRGFWYDHSRPGNYKIPLVAKYNLPHRFRFSDMPSDALDGKWQVVFGEGTEDEFDAIGLFETDANSMHGTFLTETGDYRFLEGGFGGDTLKLSTFDGSHAFLFMASLDGDTLRGTFYSGSHYQQFFKAWRNDSATIQDPYHLTQTTGPDAAVAFSGTLLNGDMFHYPAENLAGKPILLQILGSWCPNCMDESVLLSTLYPRYRKSGLEIIGLAFERHEASEALKVLGRIKKNLGIPYPLVYMGGAGKNEAAKALPFIREIKAYPTLIFIDKNGKVAKIHTGFFGPGTGQYHERQRLELIQDIEDLLED